MNKKLNIYKFNFLFIIYFIILLNNKLKYYLLNGNEL